MIANQPSSPEVGHPLLVFPELLALFSTTEILRDLWTAPISGEMLSEKRRPFSELSESSGGGSLGAALRIQKQILGMRNSIPGMASHDLSNTNTTILAATPGAIPGLDGNTHERFAFVPTLSEHFFQELGWSLRARDSFIFNDCPFLPRVRGFGSDATPCLEWFESS